MKVANLPQLPSVAYPKGPAVVEIDYTGPRTENTLLGHIPQDVSLVGRDGFSPASYRQVMGGGQEVWREQPVLDAQGAPILEPQRARLNVETVSKAGYTTAGAILGGFLGGVVGFAAGCAGSSIFGQAAPMIAAPLVGAAIGGALGHRSASHDRVRLEWRECDIEKFDLTSFSGHRDLSGSKYTYSPDIETTSLGKYWKPEAVHYDARTGKETFPFTNSTGPR